MEVKSLLPAGELQDGVLSLRLLRFTPEDPEKQYVPAYHFAIHLRTGEKVGFCDFRVGYGYYVCHSGNIGYQVFPSYRGNGYAARVCRLLFELALRHGMEQVWITCKTDNVPSQKTCLRAGACWVDDVALPQDSPMYQQGYREIRRYLWKKTEEKDTQ